MNELSSPSRLPMPSSNSQLPKRDASKRRSLLLPPGSIAGAARKGSSFLAEEKPTKQRPMSMIAPNQTTSYLTSGRLNEEDEEEEQSPESRDRARAEAHAALMGGAKTQSRASAAAPKPGIERSTSVRVPGVGRTATGRKQDSIQPRSMARDASGVKDKDARPESSLSTTSRSTGEGPTSRLRAPAPSSVFSNKNGLKRSATTTTARHSRTQSALHPPSSSNSTQLRSDIRRHPTISEGSESRLQRPAFSTLQQHYSPKKNLAPKPASSTLIHPQPSETSSSPLTLDIQLLQTRLLQLSILHRQAEPALQAWSASAKRKLKHKFTDVAAECEVVQQKEKEWQRQKNVAALKEWSNGDLGLLAENVATLSNVINEIMHLIEGGGRVQQTLDVFEAWITWVEAIYNNRDQHRQAQSEFITGLGDGWRNEIAALLRKLAGLVRQLDGLGSGQESSSLNGMLNGLRMLTRGIIEELKALEALESAVVRREGKWVDKQIEGLEREIEALVA
ncbi:uncharacterized protein PV09_00793 [Verruconis gallopava]|uniref:Uncharacterized protein n=1 Tax=Verruconis gallopava TaxID=253628 RepID=A0A0D2BBW7_9PEZI|nr:uncharacterized protein PV09_00793 [Verruconis gallopava]KIW08869.1 hypothetical protein PV09_00793 [Verruconis gallopava]